MERNRDYLKQNEFITQSQSPNSIKSTDIDNEQKLESLSKMIQSVDQYLKKYDMEKKLVKKSKELER